MRNAGGLILLVIDFRLGAEERRNAFFLATSTWSETSIKLSHGVDRGSDATDIQCYRVLVGFLEYFILAVCL